MKQGYKDIFNKRGDSYQSACLKYPNIRVSERELLLNCCDIQGDELWLDVACGGGYFSEALQKSLRSGFLIKSDPSLSFLKTIPSKKSICASELHKLAFKSKVFDGISCCVGLHHLKQVDLFLKEVNRIMKRGSKLCISEVIKGSLTMRFLDELVDAANPMGHRGIYLSIEEWADQCSLAGFENIRVEEKPCDWRASTSDDLIDFCHRLFLMSQWDEKRLRSEMENFFGDECIKQARLPWSLGFITCTKK